MRFIGSMLIALLAIQAPPAVAQTAAVDAARAKGAIGERYDGYLGVVGQVSAAVQNQLDAINIQRRSLYSNLAAERGVAPSYVGLAAGCQLLARVSVGEAYMLNDGKWRRRRPAEAAPSPDYCR